LVIGYGLLASPNYQLPITNYKSSNSDPRKSVQIRLNPRSAFLFITGTRKRFPEAGDSGTLLA
jgi:hypothetical protein